MYYGRTSKKKVLRLPLEGQENLTALKRNKPLFSIINILSLNIQGRIREAAENFSFQWPGHEGLHLPPAPSLVAKLLSEKGSFFLMARPLPPLPFLVAGPLKNGSFSKSITNNCINKISYKSSRRNYIKLIYNIFVEKSFHKWFNPDPILFQSEVKISYNSFKKTLRIIQIAMILSDWIEILFCRIRAFPEGSDPDLVNLNPEPTLCQLSCLLPLFSVSGQMIDSFSSPFFLPPLFFLNKKPFSKTGISSC